MERFQSHRVEIVSIAVAVAATGAATAYYLYVSKSKKLKGTSFSSFFSVIFLMNESMEFVLDPI